MNFKTQYLFFLISITFFSCQDEELNNELEFQDEQNETSQQVDHTYMLTEGPSKNPLKGWNSGWWNDHEYASVGFQYISWDKFEPNNDGTFDFDYVEEVINRDGTKGRHLILRLYTDWFEEAGGPDWLYDDLGVKKLSDRSKTLTDFNDPNYIKEAKQAIQALANKYDNDPRMYTFQIGLIGYWGEWHTHAFEGFKFERETENSILNTYQNNFNRVQLMGRYPWREPLSTVDFIGFHNDFFGPVSHSFSFDESIEEGNKWKNGPIGGEYPPEVSEAQFDEMYNSPLGMKIIETGHYSTMQAENACEKKPSNCEGFMRMHRKMGYNYQIVKAVFADELSINDAFNVSININNIGVAPMYYDWDIQLALLKDNEVVTYLDTDDYDLRAAAPDQLFTINSNKEKLTDINLGNYELAVRIIQPNADDAKDFIWGLDARNTYILFSNELPVIEGVWNTNDNSLTGGWSVLGTISIDN